LRVWFLGDVAESPFCGDFAASLYFYELAALGDPGRPTEYDKWWNLLINGLQTLPPALSAVMPIFGFRGLQRNLLPVLSVSRNQK
jgi:hypothetical protein